MRPQIDEIYCVWSSSAWHFGGMESRNHYRSSPCDRLRVNGQPDPNRETKIAPTVLSRLLQTNLLAWRTTLPGHAPGFAQPD